MCNKDDDDDYEHIVYNKQKRPQLTTHKKTFLFYINYTTVITYLQLYLNDT